MRIMVATEETQGRRANDFCWAEEGEVVTFGNECTDQEVDGACGCRRSLVGVRTGLASTTVRVVEYEGLTRAGLVDLLSSALVGWGWFKTAEAARGMAEEDARVLEDLASRHPVGTILERRGGAVRPRSRMVA